jgi:hypothetical protein
MCVESLWRLFTLSKILDAQRVATFVIPSRSFLTRDNCVSQYSVMSSQFVIYNSLDYSSTFEVTGCLAGQEIRPLLKLIILHRVQNTANGPVHSQLNATHIFINCTVKIGLYFCNICRTAAPYRTRQLPFMVLKCNYVNKELEGYRERCIFCSYVSDFCRLVDND